MKRHLFLSLLALLLFAGTLCAQPPKKFYTKFGGDGDDIAYSGKQILDGQYIVAGSSTSYFSNGKSDMYLVKVDSFGFPGWQRFIGGIGNDVAKSVIQLPDSGFVLAGYTSSYGAGGYDAYIVRTDKNGDVIWEKTWGGEDWDYANDLVQASDGHIVVVGHTSSFGSGKKDGFALKYDINGNLLWQKFYGGAEDEELRSVIKTNDNLLATTGLTKSRGDVNGDIYFLKLDLAGDTVFTKVFGGPLTDYGNDLVQKYNDDYYIGGAKTRTVNPQTYSYMIRISSTGDFLSDDNYYQSSHSVNNHEDFISVANSTQADYLTGFARSKSFPVFGMQAEILISYMSGYFYKQNDVGGYENDFVYSIEAVRDGGFLMVGSTQSFDSDGFDVYLMKHDSAWAGVVNYANVVGVSESINNNKVEIFYDKDGTPIVNFGDALKPREVVVLSLEGKTVKTIEKVNTQTEIDLSNISKGVYLVQLRYSDGTVSNKKIIQFKDN